jgi:hypothetical protein
MKIHQILDEWSAIDPGIIDALKEKGYEYINRGGDQAAFLEPGTGHVLKIFGTNYGADVETTSDGKQTTNFSSDQKMFFTWYEYCEQNKTNPLLPRFSGHDSFMWDNNRYLMIRTEPLKKTQGPIRLALDDLGRLIRSWLYQYKALTVKGFMNSMQRNYPREYAVLEKKLGAERMPLMVSTLDELFNLGKSRGYHWDMHGGNFMLRSDGTPVINDPWVWTGR